jgi:DNA polymerase I-like protein with 3'-5' exonuclease and polymerase domains
MGTPRPVTIDFETASIQGRPAYPPVPVGVSIDYNDGRQPKYYGWGHPSGNNCTLEYAKSKLWEVWNDPDKLLLFHHAKFDVDVAVTHMGCNMPHWSRIHDTLYLIFLADPYASSFSLKPSSERLLKMKSVEQDSVRQWLIANKIVKKSDKHWGAHIAKAPCRLVGQYAKGDVVRARKLFNMLYPFVSKRGMMEAYDRERELMPILLENERQGIRVDLNLLRADVEKYKKALKRAELAISKILGQKERIDFNKKKVLGDILFKKKAIRNWTLTKTGRRSTAKNALTKEQYKDPKLFLAISYRNKLNTCLSTFMEPWLRTAEKLVFGTSMYSERYPLLHELTGKPIGRIFTNWNQVRQSNSGDNLAGARTGRMSTNPNFQNIPKSFYDKGDNYEHPKFIRGLPELPLCRKYILPDNGHVFGHRDYNQQEFRILSHFEGDVLQKEYLSAPKFDLHNFVQRRIQEVTGTHYQRRHVKTLNFGMLYGMGVARLAKTLGCTVEEARALKDAQRKAIPGLKAIEYELKGIARRGEVMGTWGGREYPCEPDKEIGYENDGTPILRKQDYKLLNYLIQGSAADCTKQAVINYSKIRQHGRFLVTVHDEINISVPRKHLRSEMKLLQQAMESVKFNVPMLTDGKSGKNWAELKECK